MTRKYLSLRATGTQKKISSLLTRYRHGPCTRSRDPAYAGDADCAHTLDAAWLTQFAVNNQITQTPQPPKRTR
jgi:hypothetical protein